MKPSPQQFAGLCLTLIGACVTWMSLATAVIHFLFAPSPPGGIKMDAEFEIRIMSSALNVAVPLGFAALICGGLLCVRKAMSPLPFGLLAITFLAAGICVVEFWKSMAGQFGTDINLWANHVWWYVGR
jgi:hypothetical protein